MQLREFAVKYRSCIFKLSRYHTGTRSLSPSLYLTQKGESGGDKTPITCKQFTDDPKTGGWE